MHAQLLHNTNALPWPHLKKRSDGYQAPPQIIVAGAQPAVLETEAGNVLLDENGNAIGLN